MPSTSSATPTTSSRRPRAARSSSARSSTTPTPPRTRRSPSRATSPTPPTGSSRSRPARQAGLRDLLPRRRRRPGRGEELDLPGWTRVGLSCTLGERRDQHPNRRRDRRGRRSTSRAADTVTCTHTDRPVPPPGRPAARPRCTTRRDRELRLRHRRARSRRSQTITTTEPGTAVAGRAADAAAGDVRRRRAAAGARAGGQLVARARHVRRQAAEIPLDRSRSCPGRARHVIFTNMFTPGGSIMLRKRTEGAAGAAEFIVRPLAHRARELRAARRDQRLGRHGARDGRRHVGARARAATRSSRSGRRRRPAGHWTLESVLCDGVPVGRRAGPDVVTLGEADPSADCTFVNRFSTDAGAGEPERPASSSRRTPDGGRRGAGRRGTVRRRGGDEDRVADASRAPGARTTTRSSCEQRAGPGTAYDVVASEVDPRSDARSTCTPRRASAAARGRRAARSGRCAAGNGRRSPWTSPPHASGEHATTSR